jgi:hypothetical protein
MSDTEDVVMDSDVIPSSAKGKGKALDPPANSAPFDDDNLPWCAGRAGVIIMFL